MGKAVDDAAAAAPPAAPSPPRRRSTAQRVREARDRLTSTTGTRPAFDYELLRQFAQNRITASLAVMLLVATVGFLSGLWTEPVAASVWTAAVLVIHWVITRQCVRFLAEPQGTVRLTAWRIRFVAFDFVFGVA